MIYSGIGVSMNALKVKLLPIIRSMFNWALSVYIDNRSHCNTCILSFLITCLIGW